MNKAKLRRHTGRPLSPKDLDRLAADQVYELGIDRVVKSCLGYMLNNDYPIEAIEIIATSWLKAKKVKGKENKA